MSLAVNWTDEAQETFDGIVELIDQKWGHKSASEFISHVQRVIMLISIQPYMFKEVSIPNCRQVVITKQTSMFYTVQNDSIVILFFYDNRQNPLF
ncbi:type II toxin-antitoxin system RelE/ParE family toxin [Mucilaginibacter jinjuensis]|uniref:Type II toxin-antitoxin system RelE/ParE family toxin n=1 Tax=Mucilaginibacter jinjuensis TaxID=1176721 RepID=A0ABY7T8R5_9SPHI|nr:type II toxin-antitoxin system RelE/ParE family toxin [Mucilaginibacter jinjuensis]WCT12746.1 type II toxin-antitoxin system RelE/ParE family toxin [Mucilaginibacter jinjuensis]